MQVADKDLAKFILYKPSNKFRGLVSLSYLTTQYANNVAEFGEISTFNENRINRMWDISETFDISIKALDILKKSVEGIIYLSLKPRYYEQHFVATIFHIRHDFFVFRLLDTCLDNFIQIVQDYNLFCAKKMMHNDKSYLFCVNAKQAYDSYKRVVKEVRAIIEYFSGFCELNILADRLRLNIHIDYNLNGRTLTGYSVTDTLTLEQFENDPNFITLKKILL